MKQLTDEFLEQVRSVLMQHHSDPGHREARIELLKTINNLTGEAQPAADDNDSNAPWLTEAHMLCTDAGIPHGNITERIKSLREKMADDKAGGEVVAEVSAHGDTIKLNRYLPIGTKLYTNPQPQSEEHCCARCNDVLTGSKLDGALCCDCVPRDTSPTVPDNMQDWAGMDGAIAFHLIERHADNWADAEKMMGEWLAANQTHQAPAPDSGLLDAAKEALEAFKCAGISYAFLGVATRRRIANATARLRAAIAKEIGK